MIPWLRCLSLVEFLSRKNTFSVKITCVCCHSSGYLTWESVFYLKFLLFFFISCGSCCLLRNDDLVSENHHFSLQMKKKTKREKNRRVDEILSRHYLTKTLALKWTFHFLWGPIFSHSPLKFWTVFFFFQFDQNFEPLTCGIFSCPPSFGFCFFLRNCQKKETKTKRNTYLFFHPTKTKMVDMNRHDRNVKIASRVVGIFLLINMWWWYSAQL